MNASATERAAAAFKVLRDVSPQIEAAVIATRSGEVLAAATGAADGWSTTGSTVDQFVAGISDILVEAERARVELNREPVTQCELSPGDGHVFIVADDHHLVAAVTGDDPTVGLVFYDLKTALRGLRDDSGASSSAVADAPTSAADDADSTATDEAADSEPAGETATEEAPAGAAAGTRRGGSNRRPMLRQTRHLPEQLQERDGATRIDEAATSERQAPDATTRKHYHRTDPDGSIRGRRVPDSSANPQRATVCGAVFRGRLDAVASGQFAAGSRTARSRP